SWQSLPLKEVPLDSRVRVRPGERIGLDGEVLAGQSAVDQSPITGESLPVDKQPGDRVFAGSINQHSELEYRVTTLAGHSTLGGSVHGVEEARGSRRRTRRFVDRCARL